MMMISECKSGRTRDYGTAVAALLLAVSTMTGCAAGPGAQDAELVGRVWSTDAERFVSAADVEAAVGQARYVLLGETHTAPSHHRLQARLIRAAARERRPAVVLEMVARDQQAAIDAWRAEGAEPAAFGPAVDWEKRGWPDWSIYQPVVGAAVELDLPVRGGAPARATLRSVAHGGAEALDASERGRLRLDRPLPGDGRERLRETLVGAHCGVSEHAPIDRMIDVQRTRDAAMAATLREAGADAGAVLVAGHGHTRADYGVPVYLDAGDDLVTVAFMGAGGGRSLAEQRALAGGSFAHDFVWFTEETPELVECEPGDNTDA